MTDTLALCHTIRDQAHVSGAEWVVARKEAEALAAFPAVATALQDCAAAARRRYFRELAALDALTGNTPSPFVELGK
jgi:hypothetical protein